jgi:outer membrane protein OmpA-like peptidoglycan-associated protein
MKTRHRIRPIGKAVLGAGLCLGTALYAQDTSTAPSGSTGNQDTAAQTSTGAPPSTGNKAATTGGGSSADQMPDIVELSPFGGLSLFGQVNRGLDSKLITGGVWGGRVTWNPSHYVGIELAYDYAVNNVRLITPVRPGLPSYDFGNRIHNIMLNPIFNLTPRGSRVQPYLTVGVGAMDFVPTSDAKSIARQAVTNATYGSQNLNDNLQVALNYGGGVKFHLSDHFGLRFDARGFFSRNPTFSLPNYPTGGIYIPRGDHLNGLQATAGLVFYFGQSKCPPMPPAPPPPAPLTQGAITGTEGATICQGKPVTLHSTATGPAGHTLKYAWTLNGQPADATGPDFTFTPNNSGTFNVQVTVTDPTPPPPPMEKPKKFPERCWVQPPTPPPAAPVTATATVTVTENTPTIASVTATPTELTCAADTTGTHTAQLAAQAQPSACGGNLTYKWTVSEGSVSNDTNANATFDASTLNFEGGAQGQTKTVTATVTVTSETGQTATKTVDIPVKCPPQFVRLDDVVFAKNNSRINNCGKRVLIDEAAPRVANGDYNIVLVGHRDSDERENAAPTRRGRRRAAPTPLDEQRVLNAAAVLSGGTGTCGKVDPSRIKVDWVGTDQTSDPRPGLCGTSNIPATKERRGNTVTEADKNRRVEVYLVPANSTANPPAVKNLQPLPEQQVKALGCPR